MINSTSGIAYERNHLNIPKSALSLAEGSYLSVTPSDGSPLFNSLPTGSSDFAASMWVKCKPLPEGTFYIPALFWGEPQKFFQSSLVILLSSANIPLGGENVITILAGSGASGYADGFGVNAMFNSLVAISVDYPGNVYVIDDNRIRKVTPFGVVTTVAGSGTSGFNDGTGTNAQISGKGLFIDTAGNIFVAHSHCIRKITPSGNVTTLAGNGNVNGFKDGPADVARFSYVGAVTMHSDTIYVADSSNNRIRKVTSTGIVSTFAGSGVAGFIDADGTNSQFSSPQGIAVNILGTLFVADSNNNRIRRITSSGYVTTLAGSGLPGQQDGIGTSASFKYPEELTIDSHGNLYVTDFKNNRIRKITPSGVVSTVVSTVVFQGGNDLTIDFLGNLFFYWK